MTDSNQIKSVRKAMDLLRTISDVDETSARLQYLSDHTGIPKSTCVHILNTLCSCNYVQRDSHGRYMLGPMSYYITRKSRYQGHLVRLCYPIMKWLNRKTKQTVVLATLFNNTKYIVSHIEGERELVEKGNIILGHLFETASGRAIVSNMPAMDLHDFMKANPAPTYKQWPEAFGNSKLDNVIRQIRKQGYAVAAHQLLESGIWDIGVGSAIIQNGKPVGAVALALPFCTSEQKEDPDFIHQYIPYLLRATREIDHRLAFEAEKL